MAAGALLSSGMWVAAPAVVASQLYGVDTIPRMRHHDLPNPLVAAYTTADDRQIYLAGIMTEGHFENFCETVNRKDLLSDPRFATGTARLANARECITLLDALFASRTLPEWVQMLQGLTTPWTVVQTAAEAASNPSIPRARSAAIIPASTSPVPALASQAGEGGAKPTRPSGEATSVSGPL